MKKHKTAVIVDLKQVPPGFVQIARLLPDGTPRRKHWQRILSFAHAEGEIRAVKFFRTTADARTGPVFVHREEALEYLREYDLKTSAVKQAPQQPAAAPEPTSAEAARQEIERLLAIEGKVDAILSLLREQTKHFDSPRWRQPEECEAAS